MILTNKWITPIIYTLVGDWYLKAKEKSDQRIPTIVLGITAPLHILAAHYQSMFRVPIKTRHNITAKSAQIRLMVCSLLKQTTYCD